jgi:hypothetical protein
VKNRWNPFTWHPFREYDKAPWTHVWLKEGVENRETTKAKRDEPVTMDHGTMYNHLATDVAFKYFGNGREADQKRSVPDIVNRSLLEREHER